MAPKIKQGKFEWVQCQNCNNYFSSKDTTFHANLCQPGSPEWSQSSIGYYNNLFLSGIPHLKTDCLLDIPESLQEYTIFLNPLTMKLLKLSIGQWAIVQHTYTFVVWPDHSLHLSHVGMGDKLWKELQRNEHVIVHGLSQHVMNAASVQLCHKASNDLFKQKCFFAHLKKHLEGKLITGGNEITTSFYGQPVKITVVNVVGEDMEEISLQENMHLFQNCDTHDVSERSMDKLVQSFQGTTLNDSFLTSSPIPTTKKTDKVNSTDNEHINIHEKHNVKFFRVIRNTKIDFVTSTTDKLNQNSVNYNSLTLKQCGGYCSQIKTIGDMMKRVFVNEIDKTEHFTAPKGLLLYGPSGCGKTIIAKSLIHSYDVHLVCICAPDIWSKFYGESEAKLRSLFREAKDKSPSVILLDEIDSLCPKRESSQSDVEKRVLTSLLTLIDDITSCEENVFLIGTTNKRDSIDTSLRRPGRFDREIEIGVPSANDRYLILEVFLQNISHSLTKEDIKTVADSSHGFVGADIEALLKEAGLSAVKRCSSNSCEEISVLKEDLMHGLHSVQPSAMREVAIEVPNVKWSDIGGQGELKHKLRQAIEWPLKHPESFLRLGIKPPKGLLMYGPPGCSKTMIAKALANESGINFIAIKGPELFSKWVGESEKAVREVFRKARSAAPAIVFFDEIDALAGERGSSAGGGGDVSDRVLAQLLTEIDGVEALQDVTIVAATNRPDRIDKALLRPGRLDRIVYVPLPDDETRKEIFRIQFRNMPTAEDINIEQLVEQTNKYSGAEVSAVCHEAALSAMEEDINITQIYARHFDEALKLVTPRITDSLFQFYDTYAGVSGLHSV